MLLRTIAYRSRLLCSSNSTLYIALLPLLYMCPMMVWMIERKKTNKRARERDSVRAGKSLLIVLQIQYSIHIQFVRTKVNENKQILYVCVSNKSHISFYSPFSFRVFFQLFIKCDGIFGSAILLCSANIKGNRSPQMEIEKEKGRVIERVSENGWDFKGKSCFHRSFIVSNPEERGEMKYDCTVYTHTHTSTHQHIHSFVRIFVCILIYHKQTYLKIRHSNKQVVDLRRSFLLFLCEIVSKVRSSIVAYERCSM